MNEDEECITARNFPFSVHENDNQDHLNEETELSINPIEAIQHNRSVETRDIITENNREDYSRRVLQNDKRDPSILKKWNWGAFCFSWIWGIFNGIYWPLIIIGLNFIPYIGIVLSLGICIFLGIIGNKLAWKACTTSSSANVSKEYFISIQKKWNDAGILLIVLSTFAFLLYTAISLI